MFYKNKKFKLSEFRIATFDCEAVKFNNETKEGGGSNDIDMVGFYDGKDYFCFKKGIDFLEYLWQNLEKYNKTYIYAHNFSGYDIYSFLDDIKTYFINNFRVVEIGGRFVEFTLYKKINGKEYCVIFRDSYKILPSKLAKLGESFGYPKTEQPPFDHKIYNNAQIGGEMYYKQMYNEVMKYNKNDCVILYNILKEFFEHTPYTFSSIPLTAPSLAFKTWQQMMKIKMCSELTDAWKYDDFIRKSYAGGRTEVFKMSVDNDEYCYLDVNSIYPAEMESKPLPVGQCSMFYDEENSRTLFEKGTQGFYEVEWNAPHDLHIPILWEKRDSKLIFPLNKQYDYKGNGVYAYPELKLAVDNGYKLKFSNCAVFFEMKVLFKEYVDHYKKLKFEGGAKKEIAKIFLNSVYGKLGQRTIMKSCVKLTVQEVIEYLEEGEEVTPVDLEMGLYNVTSHRMSQNIVVAWASYITAYARIRMWENIKACNYQVAYMDSVTGDSLIYTSKGVFKIQELFTKANLIINDREYCKCNYLINSYDLKEKKVLMVNPIYLMRHKVKKKGYEIFYKDYITKKCESLKVTEDHSIFTLINSHLQTVKGNDIKKLKEIIYLNKNGYTSIPVIDVKEILIDDYVYDFETPSHTFCVKNILVHNTDSIVVKKEQAHNVWIEKDTFGASKREYEVHKACFFAPKFYLMSAYDNDKKKETEILKIKGVHDFATKSIIKLGYEKAKSYLLEMAKNNLGIKTISFVQFKMSRKLLNKPRAGSSRVMEKQIHLDYAKRKVLENGIDTEPL